MKKIGALVLTTICLLLAGCGFAPRSEKHLPPQLHVLYVDAVNPYDPVVTSLERILKSVGVHLTENMQDAPVTIHINKSSWNYYIPTIINSGNAVNYNYTLSVTYQLQTAAGIPVTGPQTISVTRSLLQNANQIYVPEAIPMMKREISRTVVILLYHSLTSEGTRQALATAIKKIICKSRTDN